MIINSHRFAQPTFNVNGKVPVSVWCPSRDNAGNGTATLTDLVGSNNGTLTNMDPATDWVADTDNGGVRALDFDGSDDYVSTSASLEFIQNTLEFSISFWAVFTLNRRAFFLGNTPIASADRGHGLSFEFGIGLGTNAIRIGITRGALGNSIGYRTPDNSVGAGWTHVVVSGDGTTTGIKVYINGVDQSLTNMSAGTWTSPTGSSTRGVNIGRANFTSMIAPLLGRTDDLRYFTQTLDASDVSYLYNSGNGRGRVF